jgi:RNA polymerase sigma-70 factor (ECF subfamily)
MLGVHESTISRKVDRLAKALRKKILTEMIRRGMSRRQAEEAMEVDVRDLQLDIRRVLSQEPPPATFYKERVIARAARPAEAEPVKPNQ